MFWPWKLKPHAPAADDAVGDAAYVESLRASLKATRRELDACETARQEALGRAARQADAEKALSAYQSTAVRLAGEDRDKIRGLEAQVAHLERAARGDAEIIAAVRVEAETKALELGEAERGRLELDRRLQQLRGFVGGALNELTMADAVASAGATAQDGPFLTERLQQENERLRGEVEGLRNPVVSAEGLLEENAKLRARANKLEATINSLEADDLDDLDEEDSDLDYEDDDWDDSDLDDDDDETCGEPGCETCG